MLGCIVLHKIFKHRNCCLVVDVISMLIEKLQCFLEVGEGFFHKHFCSSMKIDTFCKQDTRQAVTTIIMLAISKRISCQPIVPKVLTMEICMKHQD